MNPKSILNLFSLKGIGQTVIPRQVSTLVITLAVLSLFVLTACGQVQASVPVVEESLPTVAPVAVTDKEPASDSTFLAANPELKTVRRYTGAIENEGSQPEARDIEVVRHNNFVAFRNLKAALESEANSSTFLAANPELGIVRRYTAAAIEGGVSQP